MTARAIVGLMLGAAVIVSDARELDAGELVTFKFPGTAGAMCARVSQFFTGVDGELWAWLVPAALPGVLVKLPASDVQRGCAQ
jgi:hypothetical protein